jgi:hypothetical protein
LSAASCVACLISAVSAAADRGGPARGGADVSLGLKLTTTAGPWRVGLSAASATDLTPMAENAHGKGEYCLMLAERWSWRRWRWSS